MLLDRSADIILKEGVALPSLPDELNQPFSFHGAWCQTIEGIWAAGEAGERATTSSTAYDASGNNYIAPVSTVKGQKPVDFR